MVGRMVFGVLLALLVLAALAPAAFAAEWIWSNSVPSYLMYCDWYGSERWCYDYEVPFTWVPA